ENITLGSLAERFSINKYHLQKQFKRYIGISPNDFLIHTRLTHAKELLRTTDYSINQIAQEIGIMEASNFSRLFKKWENMTPLEYRRYWCEPTLTVVDNL
ncbi:MAG TPA: helix-turn-helix transcriptional regulator, partial [Candidatus Blautia faecigallinarum]|nr:helix-turn-helix transcriptional regulator [Candidatus Blautia faecigallinarum]